MLFPFYIECAMQKAVMHVSKLAILSMMIELLFAKTRSRNEDCTL